MDKFKFKYQEIDKEQLIMTAQSFKITNKLLNKILIEFKENPDKEIV